MDSHIANNNNNHIKNGQLLTDLIASFPAGLSAGYIRGYS